MRHKEGEKRKENEGERREKEGKRMEKEGRKKGGKKGRNKA